MVDKILVSWHVNQKNPEDISVTQVSGFCFDAVGRLLLIKEGDTYGIPGGKPEEGEEPIETLRREIMEEAQVSINSEYYLGYQLIEGDSNLKGGNAYAQLRYICKIGAMFPSVADVATGHIFDRVLSAPGEAVVLLKWGEDSTRAVLDAARTAKEVGYF